MHFVADRITMNYARKTRPSRETRIQLFIQPLARYMFIFYARSLETIKNRLASYITLL